MARERDAGADLDEGGEEGTFFAAPIAENTARAHYHGGNSYAIYLLPFPAGATAVPSELFFSLLLSSR